MNQSNIESKINFYNDPRFVDNPFHPAGFRGTWQFSDHSLIPDVFHGFLQRYFGQYKIRRVPLDKINSLLNELWEGPGSLEKIFRLDEELKSSGKKITFTASDLESIKAKANTEEEDDDEMFEMLDLNLMEDAEEDND